MHKKTKILIGLTLILGLIAFTSYQQVKAFGEEDDPHDPGNHPGPGGDPTDPPDPDPPEPEDPTPPPTSPPQDGDVPI